MFDTSPSSFIPSSPSRPSSYIGDSRPLRSRSSATSYFALLSANEDGSNDGESFANHKPRGSTSGLTPRDMQSSWVAWFTERWHKHQLADMPDNMVQEKAPGTEQSFLNINKTLTTSEAQQLQMQKHYLPRDPEYAVVSNPATTTTASTVVSSVGTTSPLPSPSDNLLDFDVDSLDTFSELLSNFCSTLPFDATKTQAHGAAGPCGTTGLNDGDFTCLEEQHTFPLHMSDESGNTSPTSKRSREGYPGDYTNDDQAQLENITNITSKKQKTLHSWNHHPETLSPFSSNVLRPSQ
ncbi:hypothetical protein MMC18_000084 [Xylographa bjoerkii]|nr:hypothetical protein [Xylographa bjoerkii]